MSIPVKTSNAVPNLMSISLSFDPKDYICFKQIGSGFGDLTSIWLAHYNGVKKNIVIKKTKLDVSDIKKIELISHEVYLSRILAHPNIVATLAAFVCGRELWTISPCMEYGSCDKIIKEGFPLGLPEAAILLILREVLKALDNIHRMGYVHRAVKAHHILIDGNGTVCLTGLRESHCLSPNGYNHVYDFPEDAVASVPWLAPEVLEQNILGYDYRSDIYSLGITAVEMACGIEPHKNVPATQVLLAKLQENDVNLQNLNDSRLSRTCGASDSGVGDSFGVTRHGRRESVENKKFSMFFSEFVDCCLQKEPKNRPSARMLLNHAFFKQAKKKIKRSLPELLLPVRPQTFDNVAISNEEIKTANVCSVTESLDKLDVSSWNF